MDQVQKCDLIALADVLRKYLPVSMLVETAVRSTAQFDTSEVIGAQFFTPQNPDFRDKMVVHTPSGTYKEWENLGIFWTPDIPDEVVLDCLRSLETMNVVNWKRPVCLHYIHESLRHKMEGFVRKLSGGVMDVRLRGYCPTFHHEGQLPPKPEIPTGFIIGKIDDKYMGDIYGRWMLRYLEDFTSFVKLFKILPTVAIYKINDDGIEKKKELASYSAIHHNGEIGLTYTFEKYRGKGLAKRIAWELTNEALQNNFLPYVNVEKQNAPSIKLYKSMGYVNISTTCMVLFIDDRFVEKYDPENPEDIFYPIQKHLVHDALVSVEG